MKSASAMILDLTRILLPVIILGGGVASFGVLSSRRAAPPTVERPVPIPTVETLPVEVHENALTFYVDGIVVPHREIQISAEVRGRITEKSERCRAGKYVKAGEILLRIDPRMYELEVKRISEEVVQANASIEENDVEISNIQELIDIATDDVAIQRREYERIAALGKKNAISDSQVDGAKRAFLTAESALATLNNQLKIHKARKPRLISARDLSQVKLEQARLDHERATIRSPADGVIVSESVEEESFVQPGTSLVMIEDTTATEVRCNLRMEELLWIWQQERPTGEETPVTGPVSDYQLPDTPVTVTYRLNDREFQWSGSLSRYEGIGVDEKTRTVPCRVLIPDPRGHTTKSENTNGNRAGPRALVRGMYVKVAVHIRPSDRLLRIPRQSVLPGDVVWSVRDGILHRHELLNPHFLDDVALVALRQTDLEPGALVVSTPLAVAIEGMEVVVKSPDLAARRTEPNHD